MKNFDFFFHLILRYEKIKCKKVKILDKDDNLVGVLESSNARYLPSKFFEIWWNKVDDLGMVTNQDGIDK